MAEKILQTRILNKIDTLENWNKSTLKIKKGEICLATAAASAGTGIEEPVVMMKVGTSEEKTFAELPWAFYARSSDVLAACKSEAGLTAFVNNIIANSGLATDGAMKDLSDRVDVVEGNIETLNGDVNTAGSVAKAIADAIAALNLADTYAAKVHGHEIADVNGLADALAGLQGKGDYAAEEHNHEIDDVNGLADAIADAKKAGTDANAALETYKGTNDVAVKANADAIAAIKDHESVDSFADVMAEIAKKQDIIPAETYDAYGSAAQALADAKDYADGKDDAIAAAQKAGDDAMAEAQKKVASVTAADASMTVAGTSTAPTVAVKLDPAADNALKLNENGLKVEIGAAPEYSIVKAADAGDYAAVYNLTKDGTIVGASINIPKDIVVKSGSVVGDEIILVLNDEAATEIKIPVASLIEYVTSGSQTGDMVVVNVSDDHKVTATITDGTITLAKLTTEVQTAIGKAHAHENADVLAGINADKVSAWDAAEENAKGHADGLNTAMNARVEALEEIDHDHANKAELDKIADGDVAKWNAAEANAIAKANELNGAMNTRVEALETKVDTGDQKVSEYVAAAIEALKIGDYAKAADLAAAIEQHNTDKAALEAEIAKKANDADLAAIAKTGSTDDLVQGELVLVFDCGTSAV